MKRLELPTKEPVVPEKGYGCCYICNPTLILLEGEIVNHIFSAHYKKKLEPPADVANLTLEPGLLFK